MRRLRPPIGVFDPLRRLAATRPRGSLARKLAIAVLQQARHAYRLPQSVGLVVPCDAPALAFECVDSMVVDALYWFGVRGYEGRVADVWAGLCRDARSVLEIGGNIGLFSVLGSRACQGDYVVVEPVPHVAAVLRANLLRNGVTRAKVVEAAAVPGAQASPVTLNLPVEAHDVQVGAQLVDGNELALHGRSRRISVDGVPFAALAAGREVIKIDAEGVEAALLESAFDLLTRQRTRLLIEVLPQATKLARVLAELAQAMGVPIHIIPEYRLDDLVSVAPGDFSAGLPARYYSKDVYIGPERPFPRAF